MKNLCKVIVIDGNSFGSKYLFGSEFSAVYVNEEQILTNIMYGFLAKIIDLIDKEAPSKIIVCWDYGIQRKREIYPGYKAKRVHKVHEDYEYGDVIYTFNACMHLFRMFGIEQYRIKGEEGDDLIASYVSQNQDQKNHIMSTDHDLLQLTKFDNVKYIKDKDNWNGKKFENKYGFKPQYYPDYLSFVGDSTDDIPGVKGIGEKTASKIFTFFKEPTIDKVYENLDILPITDKQKDKIRMGEDDVRLFYRIIKLSEDLEMVPVFPRAKEIRRFIKTLKALRFTQFLNKETIRKFANL